DCEEWWHALGNDCIIDGQPDLEGLEARLCGICQAAFTGLLTTEAVQRTDVAPRFLALYSECMQRPTLMRSDPPTPTTTSVDLLPIVDREAEARSVTEFLDDRTSVVLELTGLPQIGKSSVLDKALIQSGVSQILRVPLTATSSADYILYTILRSGSGLPLPPY